MAQFNIQTAFAAGEIAPALYGHVDLAKIKVASTTARNGFISYRGGWYSRAGTALCNRAKQPWGGSPPRLIRFQFSINQGYALEFGDNYMRVFVNGAPVLEVADTITGASNANPAVLTVANTYSNGDWVVVAGVAGMTQLNGNTYIVANQNAAHFSLQDLNGNPIDSTGFGAYTGGGTVSRIFTLATPWAASDLPLLKYTQSADVMSLCNPNYAPYDMARIAANSWTLTQTTFGATIAAPASCTATATVQPGSGSPPTLPAAYAYEVTAVSGTTGNESIASPIANVTNSVDIAATAGSIIINWSSVTGAQTYNIYKAPTSYNTKPGDGSNALPVPAGALFGYIGTSYGTQFVDSNIVADDTQVPPRHEDPFAPGQILAVNITSPSSGIKTCAVTITTSTGSGFIGQAVIVNGQVNAVIVVDAGMNYANTDTPAFAVTGVGFASGTITFAANPTAGDTITLNGDVWTFVAALTAPNQTQISSTLALTLSALAAQLGASSDAQLTVASYAASPTVLTVTYKTSGTGGNAYTLAASAATPSGGTLTGGSASGTAPVGTLTVGPETGIYPGSVAYFQQRRVYASSLNDPDTFWMSQPGNFLDFDSSIPVTDADAITGTPWAQQVNGIQWMVPMPGGLVVLTGLGAWQIGGAGSSAQNPQPITPTSIQAIQQAFNGCSAVVQPLTINFDILYVQAKGSIVRDLSWNYWINIYTGTDLTQLSGQLFTGYQMLQSCWCEEPYKVGWFIRDDGVMLSITYLKEQEVYGWARHDTFGQFVSCVSVTEPPVDALYVIAARPNPSAGAGDWAYFVERTDNRIWATSEDPWCVDCGLSYPMPTPNAILFPVGTSGQVQFLASADVFSLGNVGSVIRSGGGVAVVENYISPTEVIGFWFQPPGQILANAQPADPVEYTVTPQTPGNWTMTAPITVVEGLTHLAGLYVTGLADGIPIPPQLVTPQGTITLTYPASNIKVGLPFLPQLQLPRIDPAGQQTSQGRRKTITAVTCRIEASAMIVTGTNQPDGAAQVPPQVAPVWSNLEAMQDLGAMYPAPGGGTVQTLWTGDLRVPVLPNWVKPGQIAFQQNNPLPLQITDVVAEFLEGDIPEISYEPQEQQSPYPTGPRGEQVARGPGPWMLGGRR